MESTRDTDMEIGKNGDGFFHHVLTVFRMGQKPRGIRTWDLSVWDMGHREPHAYL